MPAAEQLEGHLGNPEVWKASRGSDMTRERLQAGIFVALRKNVIRYFNEGASTTDRATEPSPHRSTVVRIPPVQISPKHQIKRPGKLLSPPTPQMPSALLDLDPNRPLHTRRDFKARAADAA